MWPIEERQVPQTGIPGEQTSPTQPFPTKPPPFDRQGMQLADVIDFTPEVRAEAERILTSRQYGPLFTPPSQRGTVAMPGFEGGASWPGGAFDPDTGKLYVPSFTAPILITLRRPDPSRSSFDFVATVSGFHGPFDLPISKPPWSRLTAYDMRRGDIAWTIPLGEGPRRHPKLAGLDLPLLGSGVRGHALVTKTLLIVSSGHSRSFRYQETKAESEWQEKPKDVTRGLAWTNPRSPARDDWRYAVPVLSAFDKATGELVPQIELPAHSDGSPITYLHRGVQYLVVAIGGRGEPFELIAYRLRLETHVESPAGDTLNRQQIRRAGPPAANRKSDRDGTSIQPSNCRPAAEPVHSRDVKTATTACLLHRLYSARLRFVFAPKLVSLVLQVSFKSPRLLSATRTALLPCPRRRHQESTWALVGLERHLRTVVQPHHTTD